VAHDQNRPVAPHIAQGTRRNRTRRIVHLLLLFGAAVLFVNAVVGDGGVVVRQLRRKEYSQLVSDLDRLKAANALMREQNRRLREDPDALEEAARRDLGLMKRGETVFIIKDQKDHLEQGDHRSQEPLPPAAQP
jgi:cell division protein FtsB